MRLFFRPLAPFAFLLLAACGGGGSDKPAPSNPMDTATAQTFTSTFLTLTENTKGDPSSLPTIVPVGEALAVQMGASPACVTVTPLSATSVRLTFTNCTSPDGGVLNGEITFTWSTTRTDYTTTFGNDTTPLTATNGPKSVAIRGTQSLSLNLIQMQGTHTANLQTTITDGTTTTYTYTCSLTSDWATSGQLKLWGTFSFAAGAMSLNGSIAQATPLVWTSGCCHPTSGTLQLSQGNLSATVVFGPTCGAVTINGQPKTLGACPT